MQAHVLSVGQCTADDARIGRLLAVEADAHLDRAATAEERTGLWPRRVMTWCWSTGCWNWTANPGWI